MLHILNLHGYYRIIPFVCHLPKFNFRSNVAVCAALLAGHVRIFAIVYVFTSTAFFPCNSHLSPMSPWLELVSLDFACTFYLFYFFVLLRVFTRMLLAGTVFHQKFSCAAIVAATCAAVTATATATAIRVLAFMLNP